MSDHSKKSRPPDRDGSGGARSRATQIPLVLPVEPGLEREDLIKGEANRLAVDLVDRWPDWPSNTVILAGPVGSGKTHLAKIWANKAGAEILPMTALASKARHTEEVSLVLEDADADTIDETALFHAFNRAREAGQFILLTSRSFPSSWSLTLPDLLSRLKLAHVVELHEPDDAMLSAIIFKLFADRQLEVSPQLVKYLVSRMERSMETATRLVDWIDKEALARRRKLNRGLAAEALKVFETDQ